ncbi:hypothetical protein [Hyphomicrobium sp. D-2]|uniref:hypothetical protein n=1 Tax=Hyphomicrobium sp. D-2 TaxID=3041621 RepID=UPI0024588514|nr:hypothetical protein [Hyphomicrobium sp. D-2]MDH4981464.1 hypothetical protein [Hyphomicrobium sp. D-2]
MAMNGHALGGAAQAIQADNVLKLKRDEQAQQTAHQNATLALEERKLGASQRGALLKQAAGVVDGLLKTIGDTATAFRNAGHGTDKTTAAVAPMVEQLKGIYASAGMDPAPALSQIQAIVGMPVQPGTGDQKDYLFYQQQEQAAGRPAMSFNEFTTQQKKAGASSTNVTVGGEAAFAKTLGEGAAKDLMARREGAQDAAKSLESTYQATLLLDSGVITGTGADWLLKAGKTLQQVGINLAPDAIANTEAFAAQRAQEVGRVIKLFGAGTGLSDADREYALQAAAGKITLNEQSIRRILDINSRAARNVLTSYNADASRVDTNIVPFDLRVAEPPEPAKPPVTKVINGKTYWQHDGKWFDAPPGSQ